MKYSYNFSDSVDVIDNRILKRESYDIFISEILNLNTKFNYSIYIFGSYIGYMINKDEYNDIDFIITSEKIIELNELTNFFREFHLICKKFNVAYNLMYSTDKTSDDFDQNLYVGSLFKTGDSNVIRLYKRIDIGGKLGMEFKPLIGTDLYEGNLPPISQKIAKNMQMGVKYYYPIKIQ